MEDNRIRNHYTLTVNRDGFRGQQHTVDAYTIPDAIRKLVFRIFPRKSASDSLALADEIYDRQSYEVVGQTPAYEDMFRTDNKPTRKQPDTTLRDVAKDMEDMGNIKNTIDEFPIDPDQEEPDGQ